MKWSRKRFTLIELLVVVAIIAILAALLLPMLSRAKQSAIAALCINNQKQGVLGMQMYSNDFNGAVYIGYERTGFGQRYDWSYFLYQQGLIDVASQVWHCPKSVNRSDVSSMRTQSYGENMFGYLKQQTGVAVKTTDFDFPATAGIAPIMGGYGAFIDLPRVPEPDNYWLLADNKTSNPVPYNNGWHHPLWIPQGVGWAPRWWFAHPGRQVTVAKADGSVIREKPDYFLEYVWSPTYFALAPDHDWR